jgi:hypothetical protein
MARFRLLAGLNAKNKKAHRSELFCFKWLGYEDSNLGMLVSETRALPLGDTPTDFLTLTMFTEKWLGCRDSNPGMLVSETSALPLGDTPSGVLFSF